METEYYYLRLSETKPQSWILCTKARAEKRLKAAMETESFYNFVASVTETEDFITVRDIETEDFSGLATITLNKEFLFGGEDKTRRAQIALDIFHSTANCFQNWALRQ